VVLGARSRTAANAAFVCVDQARLLFYCVELIVICLALLSNVSLCFPRVIGSLRTGGGTKLLYLRGCCQPDLNLLSGDARLRYKPALPT
jgi:hypothetical protein